MDLTGRAGNARALVMPRLAEFADADIERVLDERPSHRAPASRFREELEDYMSEDYAERTIKTVINLARYGEVFAYDENAQSFSHENPV